MESMKLERKVFNPSKQYLVNLSSPGKTHNWGNSPKLTGESIVYCLSTGNTTEGMRECHLLKFSASTENAPFFL